MSASVHPSPERGDRASTASSPERRRLALIVMLVMTAASALLSLTAFHAGPAWIHWAGSVVALLAALGVVAMTELNWQRAVSTAEAAGLVARSRT